MQDLKKEQDGYKVIPVVRKLDHAIVQRNYLQIKQDVQDIVQMKLERVLNDPSMKQLIVKK